MKTSTRQRPLLTATLLATACVALVGFGGGRDDDRDRGGNGKEPPFAVPKAKCGPHDRTETALQGQVPAALRASGFKGFNCNLDLIGQSRGDGANWQTTEFREKEHHHHWHKKGHRDHGDPRVCAYHGTASPALSRPNRANMGVPVIDVTRADRPVPTAHLTTTSMLDPWESLKVNERRQLLAADNGQNGGGGSEIDLYDLSDDCRYPQLLATVAVGTGTDGGITPSFVPIGHEGSFAPDGLTYYVGDTRNRSYHAIDVSDPTRPKMIATFDMKTLGLASHGLSVSEDGKRAYVVTPLSTAPADLQNPAVAATNGFVILDTSEVQKRKPNAQMKVIGKFLFKDGGTAQHTIPVRIDGKPYVIHVDEGGSGGITSQAQFDAACAAGMAPFPLARIVDIRDERNPTLVSKLALEVHNPANCGKVAPDIVGLSIFTYGSHYCSVDNRLNATTLACGYFNSGIRVFDIRDPRRPTEIAYFNPAGVAQDSPGSNHNLLDNFRPNGADWCSAQVHLDAKRGTLWTTCQDNGLLMLKFRKGVWPFPDSSTPAGLQN